jgi:ABC-type Fe3+-hydroxamate transport system substrate-binding protein
VKLTHELLGPVEIPDEPRRVVSLAPNATATIFALGAGGRLVGRSAFCWRPPEAEGLPVVASYTRVRWELLAELKPDVVFTTSGVQREVTLALHERGYPVWSLPLPVSPWGILENVRYLAAFLGVDDGGLAADLAGRYLELAGALRGVRVYLEYQLGEPITIGRGAFMNAAFEHLGAVNVFADRPEAYFPAPLEEVPGRRPKLLIIEPRRIKNRRRQLENVEEELARRGWRGVKALVTGGDELSHSGPEFFDYLSGVVEPARQVLET